MLNQRARLMRAALGFLSVEPCEPELRLHADCVALWYAARAERMTERPKLLAGLRILVVDDHEDSRDLLHQAFSFLGAHVIVAATAEEGLGSVADADVVITDFGLKGKDGAWLLAQINASPRPVPVILLSGFVQTVDAPFALKLLKPFDPMDLAKETRVLVR